MLDKLSGSLTDIVVGHRRGISRCHCVESERVHLPKPRPAPHARRERVDEDHLAPRTPRLCVSRAQPLHEQRRVECARKRSEARVFLNEEVCEVLEERIAAEEVGDGRDLEHRGDAFAHVEGRVHALKE